MALRIFGLVALIALVGCNPPKKQEKKKRARPPKVTVKLPPVQDLKVPEYQKYYADQSLTVQHLLRSTSTLFRKEDTVVAVTGIIDGLKRCEKKDEKRCVIVPHFYLVDKLGDQRWRLLVTDLPADKVETFRQGGKFRIEGTLARFSADGNFSSLRGLLRYKNGADLEKKPEDPEKKDEDDTKKKKKNGKKRRK